MRWGWAKGEVEEREGHGGVGGGGVIGEGKNEILCEESRNGLWGGAGELEM